MDPDSPVEIKAFDVEWKAEMARINLEGAGIFTIVKPAPAKGDGQPAILIQAKDVEIALDVLRDFGNST